MCIIFTAILTAEVEVDTFWLCFCRFGSGTGQIWLDDVNCAGTESRLISCPNRGVGSHNCFHSEDVAVYCSPRKLLYTVATCTMQVVGSDYPSIEYMHTSVQFCSSLNVLEIGFVHRTKNVMQYVQAVLLPSFGVPMVSASPPHSDVTVFLGDVRMAATR